MLHQYRHILAKIAAAILCPFFAWSGHSLNNLGLDELQALRQLERVLPSDIAALIPGPVNINATADTLDEIISSTYTQTPSLYYRYRHEVEKRDSEGKPYWDTIEDYSKIVNFQLVDSTGSINTNTFSFQNSIHWSVKKSFQVIKDKHRYTEWRIEPGTQLFVLGYIQPDSPAFSVSFPNNKKFRPIVSTYGQDYEQQQIGNYGILYLWAGITLLGFAIFCLAFLLNLHRVWIYLLIVMLAQSTYLTQVSLSMLKQDMEDSSLRLTQQQRFSQDLLTISEANQNKAIRIHLMASYLKTQEQFQRIPEKWLNLIWHINIDKPLITLTADELAQAKNQVVNLPSTKLRSMLLATAAVLAFILGIACAWAGIRFIRHKRIIENIATQQAAGVVPGITEVKGTVALNKEESAIQSPLSQSDCVWYDYTVEELRRVGKSSRWVIIDHQKNSILFHCKDKSGQLTIDPESAEVLTNHKHVKRKRHLIANDIRYTELTLQLGDPLFAIGEAMVDRLQCDKVRMQKKNRQWPFIISNRSEKEVMMNRGRWGLFWLNFGFSGLMFSTLLMFAQTGSFSPLDILLSALAAPFYLMLFTAILHYNDLIFLQQRVERNYANIQVALKKRKNLIPSLEKLAKALMNHEASLHKTVSEFRTHHLNSRQNARAIAGFLQKEKQLFNQIKAINEKYPKLNANKSIKKLMTIIQKLENEIELLRSGHLNAITIYNTRIESFPDLMLAKAFNFKKRPRLF